MSKPDPLERVRLIAAFALAACLLYPASMRAEILQFPLGVADMAENVAYISTALGIEAIRLDSGATLWRDERTGWPLWKVDRRLLVVSRLANESVLVKLLDTDKKEVVDSMPARIPISDARSLMQSAEAPQVQMKNDVFYVRWRRTSKYAGGANPPPELLGNPVNAPFATLKIDFGSRTAKLTEEWPVAANDCSSPANTKVVFKRRGQDQCGTWKLDGVKASLEKRKDSLVLATTNKTGRHTVVLAPASRGEPFVTDDGRFVVITAPDAGTSVYSILSGRLVRRMEGHTDVKALSLIGPRLFLLSQTGSHSYLSCVLLPQGEPGWKREVSVEPAALPADLPK
jgi:hypothetical protein